MDPKEFFMCKVQPEPNTGCWFWDSSVNKAGYGRICFNGVNGKIWLAHRASYELFISPFPLTMHVLHKCDQPCCVNPDHLFLGTNLDNILDRVKKGRSAHNTPAAKLSPEQIREIRTSYSLGNITQRKLAKIYSVGCGTICNVVTNKSWSNI